MNRRRFLYSATAGVGALAIFETLQTDPPPLRGAWCGTAAMDPEQAVSGPVDLLRLEPTPPYVEAGTALTASLQFRNRSLDPIPLEPLSVLVRAYDTQTEIVRDVAKVTGQLEPDSDTWVTAEVYPDSDPGRYHLAVEHGPRVSVHVVERHPDTPTPRNDPRTKRPTDDSEPTPDGATIQ